MAEDWLNAPYRLEGKTVWVAGHEGLVGSAVLRALASEPCRVVTASRSALDLRDQSAVLNWMTAHRPEAIILCAAKVGGIGANAAFPAEFLYDNLMISANVIHAAFLCGVERLVFLGSSCIYPKAAPQPIAEDALLTGPLEPTNAPYALAKIAGVKMVEAYRRQYGCGFVSVMPCNLYGPQDRFDLEASHVIPALMMKCHAARETGAPEVSVWGSGSPLREFLYVD